MQPTGSALISGRRTLSIRNLISDPSDIIIYVVVHECQGTIYTTTHLSFETARAFALKIIQDDLKHQPTQDDDVARMLHWIKENPHDNYPDIEELFNLYSEDEESIHIHRCPLEKTLPDNSDDDQS